MKNILIKQLSTQGEHFQAYKDEIHHLTKSENIIIKNIEHKVKITTEEPITCN